MSTDITEGPNDYHVEVDLPGVHMDDLDITVSNGRLNITAERRELHREKALRMHKVERSFGKVKRSIPIPAGAVESSADAKFDKGVLTGLTIVPNSSHLTALVIVCLQ
jgi:HSP20 family protein